MAQIVDANIKFKKVLVDRIEWETTKKAESHEIWKMDDLKVYMLNKSTEWIKDKEFIDANKEVIMRGLAMMILITVLIITGMTYMFGRFGFKSFFE